MSKLKKFVEEIPNKKTAMRLKDALNDIRTGNVSPSFDTAEEAVRWLKKACNEKEDSNHKTIHKTTQKITKKDTNRVLNKTKIVQGRIKQYNLKQTYIER